MSARNILNIKNFLYRSDTTGLLSPKRNQLGRVILARNVKISAVYLYQTRAEATQTRIHAEYECKLPQPTAGMAKIKLGMA